MKLRLLIALAILPYITMAQYNWHALPAAPKSQRCDDIFFLNPQVGWAINANFSSPRGRIFKTSDAGETWQLLKDSSISYYRSVGFADELTGWVGHLYPLGPDTFVLSETTDGGVSWHMANLPYPRPAGICGISVVSENVTYAYGPYYGPAGYVKTTDKGATWQYKDMNSMAGGFVDGFFFDQDTGFITGCTHDEKALILITYNGGDTWDTCYVSTRSDTDIVWKIVFPGGNTGYASVEHVGDATTYNTYFLKTTDRGRTWTEHPFIPNYYELGVGFINDSVGWIGGDYIMPTYKTTDGGTTWAPDPGFGVLTPPYHEYPGGFFPGFSINRFRRFGDTLLYATGKTVYKMNTKEAAGNERIDIEKESVKNYPNPFRYHTNISYSLPQAATHLLLEVHNAVGILVFSKDLGAQAQGKHQYTFAEPLLPGMYHYTLRTERYRITNKMLVMR